MFFLVAALTSILAAIDGTAVIVAFPVMVDEFNANLAWLGWVFTAYSLVLGIVMPLVGRATDVLGLRRAFIGAVVVFMLGSIGCALAKSVELLVLFRAVQAVGGGAFMPLAMGIVSRTFVENRSRMIGLMSTIWPLGSIIGPNVAGVLIATSGWRAIFLINVPICLGSIGLAAWLLAPDANAGRRPALAKLDTIGVSMLAFGVLAVMTGLTFATGRAEPWLDPAVAGLVVGGLGLLAGFFSWEGRVAAPIVDLELLRHRPFVAANVLSFGISAFVFSIGSFQPLFGSRAYGFTASENGLLLTPRGIGSVIAGTLASFVIRRTGYRLPIFAGLSLAATSFILVSLQPHALAIGPLVVPEGVVLAAVIALGGIGMGMTLPSANSTAIDLMPERATAISGLRGLFNILGGVLGTTVALVVVSRAENQVAGLSVVFVGAAVCVAALLGVVPFIANGRRNRAPAESGHSEGNDPSKED